MTWSRFAQSLIAAIILSSLTVACGKSDRKEKISLRTSGGANGKVAPQPDAVGTEKDALANTSEKMKQNMAQLESQTVKDSDIEEALDYARKAKTIDIDSLPVGKYRLAQVRSSLFVTDIKSPFKGLQILNVKLDGEFDGKPTQTYSVQNEHALKSGDVLAPEILRSEFDILENQAPVKTLSLSESSDFAFGSIFNTNKTSAFSIIKSEDELFDPLSYLFDQRKSRFAGGNYEGPEIKERKLSSYFKITQISQAEYAIIYTKEVGSTNSPERIRNLILIYSFEKATSPAPEKKEDGAPANTDSTTSRPPTPTAPSSPVDQGTATEEEKTPAQSIVDLPKEPIDSEEPSPEISEDDVGI